MRSIRILALAASGCRAVLGIGDPPAPPDAGGDLGACATWHPDGFDPCALAITTPALTLGDEPYIYDTRMSAGGTLYDGAHRIVVHSEQTVRDTDGSVVAVLSIGRLTTSAATMLKVIGPRPLLIVSWSSIRIDGAIDAGSHLGTKDVATHLSETVQFGPGANQDCMAGAGSNGGNATSGGSGGGGGGSLQAVGGTGGRDGKTGVRGGAGGQAMAIAFHGGCPGGASGASGPIALPPAPSGSRALGGAGGGAIRLVARDSIEIHGSISANGAGGAGAPKGSACGGGGGGSGGYIGLEAPVIKLGGSITANGGGGGAGGDPDSAGNDGADGEVGTQPAPGGAASSTSCGQSGGAGAAAAMLCGAAASDSLPCASGSSAGGGGGGGGASGFILIKSPGYTPDAATLSPAPQLE